MLTMIFSLIFANIAYAAQQSDDPYETYNRHMYAFNDQIDRAILKPVAKAYNFVLPSFVRTGIDNFFSNLDEVPSIINDLLQAEFYHATSDTWRFAINSTFGIGGFFDPASKIGLEEHYNDLGLTFAKWGYESSSYFVLPILGPRTVRDSLGVGGDFFALSVYPYIVNRPVRFGLVTLWLIEYRAQLLQFDSTINALAFDPYVFQRNAYLQHRTAAIRENNGEPENADAVSHGVVLIPAN